MLVNLGAEFSIVIPTLDNPEMVHEIIENLGKQTLLPKEIVFCDSSSSDSVHDVIKRSNSEILLTYVRLGRSYRFDRFLKALFSVNLVKKLFPDYQLAPGRAFPYEASNHGAQVAQFEWLAFLDASTIPSDNWLEKYWDFVNDNQLDVVFGNTEYEAHSTFQKLLRASIYGANGHETAPGSIIRKKQFLEGYRIAEGVRSGGDVAWKMKIKDSLNYYLPSKSYLSYSSLPNSLLATLKKFFTYQIYGSFLDIQNNIKDLYLGIALLLSIMLIPKWNYIVGWDSIFFIPHITKIFFLSLFLIIFISFTINRIFFRKLAPNSFRANSLKLVLFFIIAYSIFNWNAVVAKWVEDSIWYVPHITKIFVSLVFAASFMYRGVYFPLKNKIRFSYLFPYRWFLVGILGILLDLVKAPGYLLGAILASFVRRAKNIK